MTTEAEAKEEGVKNPPKVGDEAYGCMSLHAVYIHVLTPATGDIHRSEWEAGGAQSAHVE